MMDYEVDNGIKMDSVHGMKEHKGCTAIHDIFYSLAARYQILCFDMKMK